MYFFLNIISIFFSNNCNVNFGENSHNSNCAVVVGQTLFLCGNFNCVCNLYLKYDKKNYLM